MQAIRRRVGYCSLTALIVAASLDGECAKSKYAVAFSLSAIFCNLFAAPLYVDIACKKSLSEIPSSLQAR